MVISPHTLGHQPCQCNACQTVQLNQWLRLSTRHVTQCVRDNAGPSDMFLHSRVSLAASLQTFEVFDCRLREMRGTDVTSANSFRKCMSWPSYSVWGSKWGLVLALLPLLLLLMPMLLVEPLVPNTSHPVASNTRNTNTASALARDKRRGGAYN